MRLGTKERLKLFGQMVIGLYIIFLIALIIMQKLSLETVGIAFVAAFGIIGLIFLILGDHR